MVLAKPAGILENVQEDAESAVLNPLPVTVIEVPGDPELGESVIEGDVVVTTNVAKATSPVGVPPVPVTVIV